MRIKTTNLLRLAIVFLFIAMTAMAQAATDDFDVLMQRIRKDFSRNPNIEATFKQYDAQKGAFTDIDYSRDDLTNWPPLKHLERLQQWAAAYTNSKNKHYGEDALYENIVKALQHWQNVNPNCRNWWYNQIAEPQSLGITLILLRSGKKQVPHELETAILNRMREEGGDPAKWTGANRTDICLHWIYRSCLERDEKDLSTAMQLVFDPVRYTTEEGFQHDNSYFQHSVQLYIGGYGDEVLKGVTQVAMYALGTKYALSAEKVQILSKFMRETYYQTIRGQYMLWDVMGRSVSRRNMLNKKDKAKFAQRMIELDPKHADEFRQIIDRMNGKQQPSYAIQPRHTHYFRADYSLHVRPGYIFDVRLVSNRTARLEYGNRENLKTYFASDGCNSIVKHGDEYFNIFPTWDWARIPGTTAPHLDEIPLAKKDWMQPGTSKFAGGVSDSIYGATTYAYNDRWDGINTEAKKSWFFFDNEIVCLGAGITSDNEAPIMTSLNQRLANRGDKLTYANVKGAATEGTSAEGNNVAWVMYDGVGYAMPNGGNVKAEIKKQSGTWHAINQTQIKTEQTNDVFSVTLDHGAKPNNATYAYIVVPEANTADRMAEYAKHKHIAILSNTPQIQAVQQTDLGVWQAVFFEASQYKDKNITLTADRPCAVMIRRMPNGSTVMHVADPAQKQQPINISVKLKGMKKAATVNCDFTGTGIYAGATKKYTL